MQGFCLLKSSLPGSALGTHVELRGKPHDSTGVLKALPGKIDIRISKGAKIRNRYNQVPHLTQDTYGKVTNSQLDTTNESKEVSHFPAGGQKAHI